MSAGVGEIAKAAGAVLVELLGRKLKTDKWKLRGTFRAEPTDKKGLYTITVPEKDPLRLVHVASGRALVVPYRKFESDFASVPAMVRALFGKVSALHLEPRDYEEPVVMHDAFYGAGWCWAVRTVEGDGKAVREAVRVPMSKEQADAALFVGLECKGATLADGVAYHGGVAIFGGRRWAAGIAEGQEKVASGEWEVLWGEAGGNER